MRPEYWQPPIELSSSEAFVLECIKRAKLFVFLRQNRHELFDTAFQEDLNQSISIEDPHMRQGRKSRQQRVVTLWWIVTETEEDIDRTVEVEGRRSSTDRGGGFGLPESIEAIKTTVTRRQRVSVDAQLLKAQMASMVSIVNDLFSQAESQSELQLNEVELSVEINAEGQISLVGNGGKLGNSGGITLKFVRPS